VLQLAALLRSKQVTSRELTAVFTQRLKRCACARRCPGLHAVARLAAARRRA